MPSESNWFKRDDQYPDEYHYLATQISWGGFQSCAKIKDAEIEQLNAKVAMMSESIKEIWYSNSTQIEETKFYEIIKATEADVTKFINGVRAARDAEWMAEPVAKCFMSTTSDDEGRFYPILVAGLVDGYPEELDGKSTILYAQPKESK
jgi:hypothetical protein